MSACDKTLGGLQTKLSELSDGWKNPAYSRLSTTHGHITDCKLVYMYWTRLSLVRPAASLYSASPLKHHPTGKQLCPNPDHYSDSEPARRSINALGQCILVFIIQKQNMYFYRVLF